MSAPGHYPHECEFIPKRGAADEDAGYLASSSRRPARAAISSSSTPRDFETIRSSSSSSQCTFRTRFTALSSQSRLVVMYNERRELFRRRRGTDAIISMRTNASTARASAPASRRRTARFAAPRSTSSPRARCETARRRRRTRRRPRPPRTHRIRSTRVRTRAPTSSTPPRRRRGR